MKTNVSAGKGRTLITGNFNCTIRCLIPGVFTILFSSCNQPQITPFHPVLGKIKIPSDNPLTSEKIALGKAFFFDKRLSLSNTISCATCHDPKRAFTDGLPKSKGHKGRFALRNAPSLLNVGFRRFLMVDGGVPTLEMQVLVPLLDTNEMSANLAELLKELPKIEKYRIATKNIFNRPIDAFVITRSLAAYQRSLVTSGSRFDSYTNGNQKALTKSEKRGWKLFNEKLECTKCHSGKNLTNDNFKKNQLTALSVTDLGRYRIDGKENSKGAFRVPSLRNVTLTAPYMHDGSYSSLLEVLESYEKQSKTGHIGSKFFQSFQLSKPEKQDLLHFFNSLVDTSLIFLD